MSTECSVTGASLLYFCFAMKKCRLFAARRYLCSGAATASPKVPRSVKSTSSHRPGVSIVASLCITLSHMAGDLPARHVLQVDEMFCRRLPQKLLFKHKDRRFCNVIPGFSNVLNIYIRCFTSLASLAAAVANENYIKFTFFLRHFPSMCVLFYSRLSTGCFFNTVAWLLG